MSRTKKKGCNPLVGILVLGSILLIGIVVSFFVGKIMLNNWVQGEGLQALIKSKTEAQIKANIDIDRKMLSELAIQQPDAFKEIVTKAKAAL